MSIVAIERMERAVLSLCGAFGVCGSRSSSSALVHATGADVLLPANTYALPILTSAAGSQWADPALLVKTLADVTVTAAGVAVPIVSVLGGLNMNFPAGTVLRWELDPSVGVEATSVCAGAFTGGTESAQPGALKRVVNFEGIGQGADANAFWRAQGAGAFPCGVVSWEGASEGQMYGRAKQQQTHRFRFYVVSARFDALDLRQSEGKRAISNIAEILCDRAAADGESFSNPPIKLGAGGRLGVAQTSHVYWQDFEVHHAVLRREIRNISAWTATRTELQTVLDPAKTPTTIDIVDQKF